MSGLKEGKNQYESDDIAHGYRENTAAAIFSFPKNVLVWTGKPTPVQTRSAYERDPTRSNRIPRLGNSRLLSQKILPKKKRGQATFLEGSGVDLVFSTLTPDRMSPRW